MTDKSDPGKLKAPGGVPMREPHERAGRSRRRDLAHKARNALARPQSRWQRLVRYVWDKKRG